MTRLQGSLNAAARALAPSKEASDTPLSPPPPDDKPGPATGRSGAYPNRTLTCKPGPAFRTQHAAIICLYRHASSRTESGGSCQMTIVTLISGRGNAYPGD